MAQKYPRPRKKQPYQRRKVVLFIVEGKTDKAALGLLMSRLFREDIVRFAVVGGDILVQNSIRPQNALSRMTRYINDFLSGEHFYKSDIKRIIHLMDTDGAFIPTDRVKYAPISGTRYLDDAIETRNVHDTRDRIRGKRAVAGFLASKDRIAGIPYGLYYLSRNIEHTFFGEEKSITSRQKCDFADRFEERFADRPEKFEDFVKKAEFAVPGAYPETWDFIMEDTRSLHRHSNLHHIFKTNGKKD